MLFRSAKLKLRCGAQFTSKLEGMVTDMNLSSDMQSAFSDHLGEKEGRAFLETILKRQQNCDQVLRNTVLIFDIPAEPSQDLRSRLCTAIQLSRSPVILVAGEGTLTSADSVVSHCLVLHLRMQTTTLCRIVQSVVQQEAGLEEAKTAAATEAIARSCAGDLRRALVAAQLLAPHGLGEVRRGRREQRPRAPVPRERRGHARDAHARAGRGPRRSEEHTSELQSPRRSRMPSSA